MRCIILLHFNQAFHGSQLEGSQGASQMTITDTECKAEVKVITLNFFFNLMDVERLE